MVCKVQYRTDYVTFADCFHRIYVWILFISINVCGGMHAVLQNNQVFVWTKIYYPVTISIRAKEIPSDARIDLCDET